MDLSRLLTFSFAAVLLTSQQSYACLHLEQTIDGIVALAFRHSPIGGLSYYVLSA